MTDTNPFAAEHASDPYPLYDRLRDEGRVRRLHLAPGLDPWVVTRHADIRALLADRRLGVDPATTSDEVRAAIGQGTAEEKLALLGRHLLSTDSPDHERMRRALSGGLRQTDVAALWPGIAQFAEALLDDLAPAGAADLLGDYALPLAVETITRLMGIPDEDRPAFHVWGGALVRSELEDDVAFEAVADKMGAYLFRFGRARRQAPSEDVASVLAVACNDGRLTEYEFISMLYQLFFAGHETSAYAIANAILHLLKRPALLEQVRADPTATLPAVIEEALRFEGPIKVPTWRFPLEDVEVAGVPIAAGEPILLLLGGAGRDPEIVTDPTRFGTDRPESPHLAFSFGLHRCMGAAVGRGEMHLAIEHLLRRLPDVRLAVAPEKLPWRTNLMMRGVERLPVAWPIPEC